MKKFSFPLDKVLDYKIQIEDNLRTEHAGMVRAVVKKEEEIESLEEEYQSYIADLDRSRRNGCRINQLRFYEGYLEESRRNIRAQKETLEDLKQQEEEKRNEVIEAKKERTSIDMLKEKKIKEYNFIVQKDEERFIEEFVANSKYHN